MQTASRHQEIYNAGNIIQFRLDYHIIIAHVGGIGKRVSIFQRELWMVVDFLARRKYFIEMAKTTAIFRISQTKI